MGTLPASQPTLPASQPTLPASQPNHGHQHHGAGGRGRCCCGRRGHREAYEEYGSGGTFRDASWFMDLTPSFFGKSTSTQKEGINFEKERMERIVFQALFFYIFFWGGLVYFLLKKFPAFPSNLCFFFPEIPIFCSRVPNRFFSGLPRFFFSVRHLRGAVSRQSSEISPLGIHHEYS